MKKDVFVNELKEGDRFDAPFLVKQARLGETRAGKPYLILTLMDKSGEVSGPVWEDAERYKELCRPGTVVRCAGMVQTYRDNIQLKIDGVQQIDEDEVDLGDFFPTSVKCREEMVRDLSLLIHSVKNSFLKKLLRAFLLQDEWLQRFKDAPAAKGIHHAYIGGLMEHSLSVGKVAEFLSVHYEGVDRDLLITGALLHDIGKLEELKLESGIIDYTASGRLKGHLVIGSEMVGRAAVKIKDFPQELLEQVQHLILSHHGRQEFGSPTVPMTVEAFMLNFLDDLDAKMNILEQLRRKMENEDLSWTDYQRSLERYLYLGGFEKKSEKVSGETAAPKQASLF